VGSNPTPRTTSQSSQCLFFWFLVAALRLVGRVMLGGCSTSITPLPAFHGVLVRCMLTSLIVVQLLAVRRVWVFCWTSFRGSRSGVVAFPWVGSVFSCGVVWSRLQVSLAGVGLQVCVDLWANLR
jgi:hypothetical protein